MGLFERHKDEEIIVRTKDELNSAANKYYGKIIPEGSAKQEIIDKMENTKTGSNLSVVTTVVGLFWWPALLVGLLGMGFTANLKKYDICKDDNDQIYFKLKSGLFG